MKNNVMGLVGVGIRHGMWNADFDNHAKMYSDGSFYASPYSLKYAIRNHFVNHQNGTVLEWKSYKIEKGNMVARTLQERFEYLTNNEVKKMNHIEIIKALYEMQDVKNFGVTFLVKKVINLGLTGVVQISNGINLDEKTEEQNSSILSPFKNSNEKSKNNTQATNGETFFLDEAHYCYNISICPYNLIQDKNIVDIEYTEEDYNNLIKGIKYGPTSLNSVSKLGAETEYILMIHLKDDYVLNETILTDKVFCKRNGSKVDYDFSKLISYLNDKKDIIEKIDFHVNEDRVNYDFTKCQIVPNIIRY